jgi:hypothetical protein
MKKLSFKLVAIIIFTQVALVKSHAQTGFTTGIPISGIKIINDYNELLNKDLNMLKVNNQIKATSVSQQKKDNAILNSSQNKSNIFLSNKDSKIVLNLPSLFTQNKICSQVVDPNRFQLSAVLRNIIVSNIARKLPKGFGIHSSSNLQLSSDCYVGANYYSIPSSPSVTIEVTIPNNRLFTRITTPDGFPGDLDPNFVVFFDFVIKVSLYLPTSTDQLSNSLNLGTVMVEAKNISKPVSKSVTGNLAIILNDLVSVLGGRDVVAELRKDKSFEYMVGNMAKLVDLSAAKKKFESLPIMRIENYADGSTLVLRITNEPEKVPVVK